MFCGLFLVSFQYYYFNFERGYQKEKYHGYIKTTFKQHHFNIVFGNTQYLTNVETIRLSHKLMILYQASLNTSVNVL